MKPTKPTKLKLILTAAAVAALSLGCANNKNAEEETSNSKYKLLNGSTADAQNETQKGAKVRDAKEPALNVETRFAAGRLAETQGRLDCAVIQYDQAVRLQKDHVPSLYRLGVVHTKMKQYDQAVVAWRKYIKATGDIASGYSNLGFCYEMARDVENAEKSYKEGLERDPNSVPCRTNYGLMLARNNRVGEAEIQLSKVLKPDEVSYNLASIYEQQGAMAMAKRELRKALEQNPKNTAAQSKLASMPMD